MTEMTTSRSRKTSPRTIARRRKARTGRPKGSLVRLLDHPLRFATAAMVAADALGYRPYHAAALVAGVLGPHPIRAKIVGGLWKLSTTVANASLRGRAGYIKTYHDRAIARATQTEIAWLIESASAIVLLVRNGSEPHVFAIGRLQLHVLGWSGVLPTLAARLLSALDAEALVNDDPLPRRARMLAEALSIEV